MTTGRSNALDVEARRACLTMPFHSEVGAQVKNDNAPNTRPTTAWLAGVADITAAVFAGLHEAAFKAVETIGTIDYLDIEAEFDSPIPGVVSTCKPAGAPL